MGTEEYWQRQNHFNKQNSSHIHPVIDQTMKDKKELVPAKNAKVLFTECLKGALFLRQYALSDDLSVDDMSMLICRDVGCELQYCQASLADPYDRPFENCDSHFRALTRCIAQEHDRYVSNPERSVQEQVLYMLEQRKKKYVNVIEVKQEETKVELDRLEMTIKL